MKPTLPRPWLLTLPLVLAPAIAHADEVYLTDGSKLVGDVEQLAYDKFKVKTEFAGEVVLDAAKIKGVTAKGPLTVQLKDGERAVGPLDYSPETGQRVGGDVPRKIDMGQVTALWPSSQDAPEIAAAKAKALAEEWTFHLELGINGQAGNTQRTIINGAAEAHHDTDDDHFTLYARGMYDHENGKDTSRDIIGGAREEVNLTKDLYWFLGGEIENDVFQNLDLRATVVGGIGDYLIHEKETEFKIHAGPGFEHQSFTNGVTRDQAVLELGENFRHDFLPWLTFVHMINYYPALDNVPRDYRVVMENYGEIPLSPDHAWKFKIGERNQYVSLPEGGAKRLDTWYYMNLVLDLK